MISLNLRILLIIAGLLIFGGVLRFVRKGILPVKYSLFWILSAFLIFLVGAVPDLIGKLTVIVGFETTSNFVVGIILFILLIISLILTIIVSKQKKQIILLIQEVSMLKKEMSECKKKIRSSFLNV